MPVSPGTRLGPYEILDLLGAGGMGEVYRARDTRLHRTVAVKVLSAEAVADPERKRRFMQEAKAASALNHPNIVTIYDIGASGGTDFIAMEYVAGKPLNQALAPGGPGLRPLLQFAAQIAAALAQAHAAGIIHRDVKPTNVMVTADGLVKVLDFGLAKLTEPVGGDGMTRTRLEAPPTEAGAILGTAAYMSPEQAEGKRIDARSDIFSFGVVLYEMVTGRRPFSGDSAVSTLAAVLREDPAPASHLRRDLPPEVETIISRCLRKDPGRRFQHMDEVKAALDDALLERPAKETETVPSIAVLPFANLSADKDNEYFSDGLAEEILNALTQLPGLRVIARASAFAFRGREHAIGEIGEKLKVQSILQGSVRRAGNRIRVTAQLIQVADESQLWSERYDRELTDVFAIQDEIAQAIVEKLRVKLGGKSGQPLVKRYTENLEAHSLYLKGIFHMDRLTGEEMEKGRGYLEQAVAAEPGYAPALVELASYHFGRSIMAVAPPLEEFPKELEAAQRAVAADETLGDAHCALAITEAFYQFRWQEALGRFQTALRLSPASSRARWWHGHVLFAVGRMEESLAEFHRSLDLDPLSTLSHTFVASAYSLTGRHDRAIHYSRQALDIDPHHWMALALLGEGYSCLGQFDEGIAWLEKARQALPGEFWPTGYLGCAYVRGGKRADAERLLAELEEKRRHQYVSALGMVMVAVALGEVDRAFAWLETGVEERDPNLCALIPDPHYQPLRADPRYLQILRRVNLAPPK